MYLSDLDLEALRLRIAQVWLELSGEPLTPGSLEDVYSRVLVLIASWSKIDTETAIKDAYSRYAEEIYKLPYGAGNKAAIIALAKAYTDVADVNIGAITTPLTIPVYLLAKTGTPTVGQIAGLANYLNSAKVQNACDTYVVSAASQLLWNFNADLSVSGDPIALKTLATAAVTNYAATKLKLGATIRPVELSTALKNITGIVDVALITPIANILTTPNQFPKLGTVTITTTIV